MIAKQVPQAQSAPRVAAPLAARFPRKAAAVGPQVMSASLRPPHASRRGDPATRPTRFGPLRRRVRAPRLLSTAGHMRAETEAAFSGRAAFQSLNHRVRVPGDRFEGSWEPGHRGPQSRGRCRVATSSHSLALPCVETARRGWLWTAGLRADGHLRRGTASPCVRARGRLLTLKESLRARAMRHVRERQESLPPRAMRHVRER